MDIQPKKISNGVKYFYIIKTMKTAIKILLCSSITAICLAQSFCLAVTQSELQDAINKKNQELQQVNAQIEATQQQLGETQSKGTSLKKEITNVDKQIGQLNLNIKSSELTIDKLNLEINSLQYDITDTGEKVVSKKEAIAEILRQLQQNGEETPLTVFLRSDKLTDGFFEIQGLKDLNKNLASEVSELKVFETQLTSALDATTNKQQKVKSENQTLKNKKSINDDLKKSKQVILQQTKNQETVYQKQLSELEKQQQAISDEIGKFEEELRKVFDVGLLPTKRPGVFDWPIKLAKDGGTGRITQIYGIVSALYKGGKHNGLDIGTPLGTPVHAAADGTAVAVDNNDQSSYRKYQYGKYVLIKHDNNLATLYAHLSIQVVSKGASVKRGDIIGYSGNTGVSTGPHLHFGIYWSPNMMMKSIPPANGLVPVGVTINPEDYL